MSLDTISYRNYTIELEPDTDAGSPREWANVGEILYTSCRYNLGDRRTTRDEIKEITERDDVIFLPVYAYIHSGVALNTTGFSCPWDSGQCGIIWCTKETAVKEWGKTLCTKTVREKAEKYLRGEVETLSAYFAGEVVGYIVRDPEGEEIESCWGFYPEGDNYNYAISEAKAQINWHRKDKAKRLKAERLASRLEREQHLALV